MKNLTSELVEEFRDKITASRSIKFKLEWLKTAFDRVRKEGRREAVEYIEQNFGWGPLPEEEKSIDDIRLEKVLREVASVENL